MRYDDDALTQAVNQADLPRLVSSLYPESKAHPGKQDTVYAVWRGNTRTPSFSLHRHPESQVWFYSDKATGESGNAYDFLTEIFGVSPEEASKILKENAGIPDKPVQPRPGKPKAPAKGFEPKTLDPEEANRFLSRAKTGTHRPKALAHRGFKGKDLDAYQIVADGEDALIPLFSPEGELLNVKRRIANPGDQMKYRYEYSGQGSPPWVSPNFAGRQPVLIVEGELNGMIAHATLAEEGSHVAVMGVAGSGGKIYLEQLADREVYVYADGDDPGEKARERWIQEAWHAGASKVYRTQPLIEGDFCDSAGQGRAGFREQLRLILENVQTAYSEEDRRIAAFTIAELRHSAERFVSGEVILSTGFKGLDQKSGGLPESDITVVAALPSQGKALDIRTPIPTPYGFRAMGSLQEGDEVLGANGQAVNIIAATDVIHDRPCYRITFSDGATIIADAQHQWTTRVRSAGRIMQTHITEEIANSMWTPEGAANHAVKVAEPIQGRERDLPMDPYVLGVWLGDGDTRGARLTIADRDQAIVERMRSRGMIVRDLGDGGKQSCRTYRLGDGDRHNGASSPQALMRKMNLLGSKHIPSYYQLASYEQRLELLRGIMDTDGHVSRASQVEITLTDHKLAKDALDLVLGLGHIATMSDEVAKLNGREVGRRYRIRFAPILDDPIATVAFKADRLTNLGDRGRKRASWRQIVHIERVDSVPVRCIEVDADDHLFLAGRERIPTHNSALMYHMLLAYLDQDPNNKALLFTPDASPGAVLRRIATRRSKVSTDVLRYGESLSGEAKRLYGSIPEARQAWWGAYEDALTKLSQRLIMSEKQDLGEVKQDIRQHVEDGVGMVGFDYIQLFEDETRGDRDGQKRAIIDLKSMATSTVKVPMVMAAQLAKYKFGPQRRSGVPLLSDIEGIGTYHQVANQVYLVYNQDSYMMDFGLTRETYKAYRSEDEGIAHVIVGKNKEGEKGKRALLRWVPKLVAFSDL